MKKHLSNLFDGYSTMEISTWCKITSNYATRLKKGYVRPSKQVEALFTQYAEQRVPGEEWKAWRFAGKSLWTPENQEVTQGDIRALRYLKHLQREVTRIKRGRQYEVRSTSSTVLDFGRFVRLRKQQLDKKQPDVPVPRGPSSDHD